MVWAPHFYFKTSSKLDNSYGIGDPNKVQLALKTCDGNFEGRTFEYSATMLDTAVTKYMALPQNIP
jgi:hypothetical protein